ncbi:MAG: shikimate kinase, partial [Acidimicrobiales bacterium]
MGGHVLLVGMTGSGKSTVGRLVSYRLGVECIDTDEEVIRAAGRSISELFASAGEEEFRSMEARAVEEALKKSSPAVVTVGGGAILNPSSRAMVQE